MPELPPAAPMSSTPVRSTCTTSTSWSATRSIITRACGAFTGSTGTPRSLRPSGGSSHPKVRSTFRSQSRARNYPSHIAGQRYTSHMSSMGVAAKICGLSTSEAVAAAVAGGAAYVGFVFYPASPRAVSPDRAARLCAVIPPEILRVGLFVDADDALIETALAAAPIDILQFHGSESPQRVAEAKLRFSRPVMKAMPIAGPLDVLAVAPYEEAADLLLFDAKPPRRPDALPGGNGLVFDWKLIAGRSWLRPWLLSGGL